MIANKLSINIDKTNFTIFTPLRRDKDLSNVKLYLNGIPVSYAKCVKYLGVYIDEDLKWSDHIAYVCNNIKKYIGIFHKIRYKMPSSCLKNLYYATVYPHIQYGIELYANTYATYLHDLEILNNRVLRILQFKPMEYNVSKLYENYNTLQIEDLHSYKLLILIHRYFNNRGSLPQIFQNYFTTNSAVHTHKTRTQNDIHLTHCETKFGIRCLSQRGSKLWNSIPNEIKCITLKYNFQQKLKDFITRNYLSS